MTPPSIIQGSAPGRNLAEAGQYQIEKIAAKYQEKNVAVLIVTLLQKAPLAVEFVVLTDSLSVRALRVY
jgi:hypothetical protein